MTRIFAFVTVFLLVSGCDSGPGQVFSLFSREVEVADVSGACDRSVAQFVVDLDLSGYRPQSVIDDDTFVGTSPAQSASADFALTLTLQIDQDAEPDGRTYPARLMRPASSLGLDAGRPYTLDVPVVGANDLVTYRQVSAAIPNC